MLGRTTAWLLPGAEKDAQSVTSDWQPVGRTLIQGVRVMEARAVPKRSGSVVELYRDDWQGEREGIGQVFVVRLAIGALSAWHAHAETTDRLTVINGSATLALFDSREGSPTSGLVNEFNLLDARPMTIVVPPRVWHGIQNTGDRPCAVVNMPDRPYRYADPDHWRVPAECEDIPYRFSTGRTPAL